MNLTALAQNVTELAYKFQDVGNGNPSLEVKAYVSVIIKILKCLIYS